MRKHGPLTWKGGLIENLRLTVWLLFLQAAALRAHPHPHIITTYQPLQGSDAAFLPMQLADGDLFSAVETCGPLAESVAKPIFRGVVSALQHCHGLGIYHGDVKPENILLCGGEAKLTDFGSCSFGSVVSKPCSTVLYGSPESTEVLYGTSSGSYAASACDVWSLGISIVATLSGFMPWEAAHTSDRRYHYWQHAVRQSVDGVPLSVCKSMMFGSTGVSEEVVDLVCRMLHPIPSCRPSLSEIAAHQWFAAA
jgi:serine/threonine protein kinase